MKRVKRSYFSLLFSLVSFLFWSEMKGKRFGGQNDGAPSQDPPPPPTAVAAEDEEVGLNQAIGEFGALPTMFCIRIRRHVAFDSHTNTSCVTM